MIVRSNSTSMTHNVCGNALNGVPPKKGKQQLILSDETNSACLRILFAIAFLDKLWILYILNLSFTCSQCNTAHMKALCSSTDPKMSCLVF